MLARLGEQGLRVPLVMGYHTSAEDFRAQMGDFGDIVSRAPVAGIEADGQVHTDESGTVTGFTPAVLDSPGRGDFMRAQLAWLNERGILPLPCDLDGPDEPLRRGLRDIWDIDVSWLPDHEGRQVTGAATVAYNCTRQWMMMSHFGYWLSLLERYGVELEEPVVPLMLGSAHVSIAEKLETLGVAASLHITGPPRREFTQVFIDVTRECRATPEQLAVPIPKY
ncbi:hypothetical protein TM7_0342 [candidate division TM7 genomosp. GTL1]|nr:hypothetical protein TM7_0342 [candidate division TM7 genomosp. GTL1]